MTLFAHIITIGAFASISAVVLYGLARRATAPLSKGSAIILALFCSAFISVASIKTNSPPARAIGLVVSTICTNAFHAVERLTGYAVSSSATNETHDFAMPGDAQLAERIARRGAHRDGFWLFDAFTNNIALSGLEAENPVWIQTDGTITVRSPASGLSIGEVALYTTYSNITVYAPLQGSYGFLPASLWDDHCPSRIWTAVTDRGTRVITWENALLDRNPATPVSFQAEFFENGDVAYRYSSIPTNTLPIGLYRNGASQPFNSSTFNLQLSTVHWSYIGDLSDGTGDFDGDGLTDWQEVIQYHTDPRHADTDGDGVDDLVEVTYGTDPFDPDEDDDGIADGTTPEALASILATNAVSANLVIAFGSAANANGGGQQRGLIRGQPPSRDGVLNINGVPLIVKDGVTLSLSLPVGRTVDFNFVSSEYLDLDMSVSGDGTPILAYDPNGFFKGDAKLSASGRLLAADGMGIAFADASITGQCVHEYPGTRRCKVSLGENECGEWKQYATITGANADLDTLTLHVADNPRSEASLQVSFPESMMLVGALSASISMHRCEAGHGGHEYCTLCGDGDDHHTEGLSISPGRECLGVNTGDSATFSVSNGSYVQDPSWAISPEVYGGPALAGNGDSATVTAGSTTGVYAITASGEGVSASATVIVYGVDYLTIESSAFPPSQEIVHFPGMTPHPFNVTNSPVPDLHQPFLYKDAQTDFVVAPFTVDLVAHLTPDSVTADDVSCSWSLDSYDVDGTFENADSLVAHFTPESGGGVYPFVFSCGSVSNSEAVLVLPLSGARIDEIVTNDLARADAFAAKVVSKYNPKERNSVKYGLRWFYFFGMGDYRGRPNSWKAPTIWAYNQVNTSKWSGKYALGACGTVCGLPVRLSKLSNFMAAYACEKIGVTTNNQMKSQLIGTRNDDSATMSWEAGASVANGQSLYGAISNLVYSTWGPDEKVIRIWPNSQRPTNYAPPSSFGDPDFQFTSPGFMFLTDP